MMIERTSPEPTNRLERWLPPGLVAGLVLFHAINNWLWLSKNLVIRGWDRIGALVNSLFYYDTLSNLNLAALFKATVQDEIRPPLFGLSMALMYGPFGVSPDVAIMVNVVYWVLLLGASYGLGARLGGRRLGLLTAILVAFTPLVYAMSRYSYFEFSLTALTLLSLYLLQASQRFERRAVSVLLGVSLGCGLLIKRTFPLFVVGALAVVVLQARLPQRVWSLARDRPRPPWRNLALAAVGGLALAALWYLPNRDLAQTLPAGSWLLPLWSILAASSLFFLLQPAGVVSNAFASGSVALSLASLWYLPHSDFVQRALRAGWGVNDPRGRFVDWGDPATYTDYVRSIIYGFSPFYSLLLMLVLGALAIYWLRQRRRRRLLPSPWWDWDWWAVLVSLLVAYGLLSGSIYKEHRAITPLLPLLGLILAAALLKLPWRRWRRFLIVVVVLFGFVQFFTVSYTGPRELAYRTSFRLPWLKRTGLFALGPYLDTPDSGTNDPAFWLADDVLPLVEAARQRQGRETISLAVIADSSHLHLGMLAYDQLAHYPALELGDPTLDRAADAAYEALFEYDYVLLLENRNRRPVVREVEDLILRQRRAQFNQAFEEVWSFELPDGSVAHLFRRRSRTP